MSTGIVEAFGWELEQTPWMGLAACSDHRHPQLWFPDRGESMGPARAVCATCPVESDCLAYALRWNIQHGIWGGRSPQERRRLRAGAGRPRRLPAAHGTTTRYARGCRCDECRDANWQYELDRRSLFESDHARIADVRSKADFL